MRSNGQSYAKKSQSKVNVKNNHALTFLGMIVFLCLAKKKKNDPLNVHFCHSVFIW